MSGLLDTLPMIIPPCMYLLDTLPMIIPPCMYLLDLEQSHCRLLLCYSRRLPELGRKLRF